MGEILGIIVSALKHSASMSLFLMSRGRETSSLSKMHPKNGALGKGASFPPRLKGACNSEFASVIQSF